MSDITEYKPKNFWDRPEGTTGMVTIGVLALGVYALAKSLLPSILNVLDMAIAAVGKAIVLTAGSALLFALIYVLTNRSFQTAVNAVFKSAMRAVTGKIIEIDPIGIMRNYIDTLKGKKEVMDRNIAALSGQIAVIKQKIDKNKNSMDNAIRTAAVAKGRGMQMQFSLQARSAGRLEKSNITYQQMLDKMTILYRALKKYQEATEVTIVDMTEEVQVKSDEREAIVKASRAMNGAMSILRGSGPEKELFDQAMEFTVADYGQRLGEIDDFMETTKSILEGMDLQNGVYDAAAMEKLTSWERRADSLVLGGEKRLMLEDLGAAANPGTSGGGDDLRKFFKNP